MKLERIAARIAGDDINRGLDNLLVELTKLMNTLPKLQQQANSPEGKATIGGMYMDLFGLVHEFRKYIESIKALQKKAA